MTLESSRETRGGHRARRGEAIGSLRLYREVKNPEAIDNYLSRLKGELTERAIRGFYMSRIPGSYHYTVLESRRVAQVRKEQQDAGKPMSLDDVEDWLLDNVSRSELTVGVSDIITVGGAKNNKIALRVGEPSGVRSHSKSPDLDTEMAYVTSSLNALLPDELERFGTPRPHITIGGVRKNYSGIDRVLKAARFSLHSGDPILIDLGALCTKRSVHYLNSARGSIYR